MSDLRRRLEQLLPKRLSHRLTVALGLPLLLSTLAGLVVHDVLRRALQAQEELSRLDHVVEAAELLRQQLADAQAGQRGFLISGQERFLEPYQQTLHDWPFTVGTLEKLLGEESVQKSRLRKIDDLFAHWRNEVAEPAIRGRRATPPEHLDAANESRLRLIEFGVAYSSPSPGGKEAEAEVLAGADRFRGAVERALASSSDPNLVAGWREVLERARHFERAAEGGLHSPAAQRAAEALAPATAWVSELSLERHRQAILPVVSGQGKRMMDEMQALDDEILSVERARLQRAVESVEARNQVGTWLALGSVVLSVSFAIALGFLFAGRLVRPLRSIMRAASALERGDLTARAETLADDEFGRLATSFNRMASRLEVRDRRAARLHELSQLMQTASDAAEAIDFFERLTPVLFPGGSGSLHTISPSRVDLETRAIFGPDTTRNREIVRPEDCWALRKGSSHVVDDVGQTIVCAHLGGRDGIADPHACLPLIAQGELLGVLHVAYPLAALDGAPISDHQEELEAIANALALALGNLALREKLKAQSVRDGLTGLFNRRFLEEALPREIERCRRRGAPLIVAMADLDHFKRLNDTWGHEAGDLAIQRFAQELRRSFRREDLLCRYGGEEFCLVLPECELEDARRRCTTLLAEMRETQIRFGNEAVGPVTVSLGLAAFPVQGDDAETLLRAADAALYNAKRAGRDRIVEYRPSIVAA